MYIIFGTYTYIFVLLWDFIIDWNVFHRKSKHFLLRDRIGYHPCFYYVCIVLNIILRALWIINVVKFDFEPESLFFILCLLEIIRQFMWVIIRVENESFNNVECHRDYMHIPRLPVHEIKNHHY